MKVFIYLEDIHECPLCLRPLYHMGRSTEFLDCGRYKINHICNGGYEVEFDLKVSDDEETDNV